MFITLIIVSSCQNKPSKKEENAGKGDAVPVATGQTVELPAPYATESATRYSDVIGWPADKTPTAPEEFVVTKFADGLNNPRNIYIAPNRDILVAEASTKPGR
jgi:glucose/arabinose dehydrogenase